MRDSKFMRGQRWWMEGYEVHKEGGKRRPALIVSSNIINSNLCNENITVVPLTTKTERAAMRTNVVISRYNRVTSVAKCAELVTIYKNQLVSYESMVDEEVMSEVEEAIRFALGMEEIASPKAITPQECSKVVSTGFVEEKEEMPEEKEEKFDDPYLSSLTTESREYIDLMETEIKRNGKRIVWDAETEYLFMKVYTECGIEEASKKFDMTFKSATTRAYLLRKKYPEFERLKCGRKV